MHLSTTTYAIFLLLLPAVPNDDTIKSRTGMNPCLQLLFRVEIYDGSLPWLAPGFCSITYFRGTTEIPSMIFLVLNRTCNFHNFNEVKNNSGFVQ